MTACHLRGVLNVEADTASREFNMRTEWMVPKDVSGHSTSLLCPGGRPVHITLEPSAASLCVATSPPRCFSGGCLSTGQQ